MIDPAVLARAYTRFRVTERVLLTGHSHQAWPDCALDGQIRAWTDAADQVDDKWDRAFLAAQDVRIGFAGLLGDHPDQIALGGSTHELLVRFLSGLPLRARPRLVTTDGEFHSLRRQLDRLGEEGITVVRVPARPVATLAERLAHAITPGTAAVLVSAVLFETAEIVPHLGDLVRPCQAAGVELLVDAYHAVNVVPFDLTQQGLTGAYVVGGGYKYCQLGEGNCFLRFPADCAMRPVITGWYADFEHLEDAASREVGYGAGPARFAGSTYDPTSHYRGAEVFRFFREQRLQVGELRALSQRQIRRLADGFDALGLDPMVIRRDPLPLEGLGGFLALRTPQARAIAHAMKKRGVFVDSRRDLLRLGPAPYVTDAQLDEALQVMTRIL